MALQRSTVLARPLFCAVVGTLLVGALSSCDGCTQPAVPPPAGCVLDADCGLGSICSNGSCQVAPLPDGGVADDAGTSDAGTVDGGQQLGVLTVLPQDQVEFGAERLGVPVERNITLKNTGPVSLTILQIVVDDNGGGTFTADPTGFLQEDLAPGAELGVLLTHIPNDGVPDVAALKVIHTGEGGLLSVGLTAEFKGTPVLSVTTDPAALSPDITTLELGNVPVGATQAVDVLIRNRGAADSLLTVENITLTPSVGPFSATHVDLSTALLASFGGFCPAGITDCPAGTDACTGGICRVADGAPIDAFVVHIAFTPTVGGPQSSTVTVAYDGDAGALIQRDIAVHATGTSGGILITPGSATFANAFVGRTSSQPFIIENVGNANITIDGVALDSGAAWDLAHALTFPLVLVPSGQAQVTASITPAAEGVFNDVLRVTAGADDATAALSATAREAPSALVPSSIAFGNVYVGTSTQRPLSVRNGGPGVLHVLGLSISGPGASHYSVALPTLPAAVAALANPNDAAPNLSVNVTYTAPGAPTGIVDAATLRVDTDDPDLPSVDVALTGSGIQPQIVTVQSALNFGTLDIGTQATQTVEVKNNGFGPLVVTGLAVGPSGDFTAVPRSGLPATVLLGGASLFVDVTYVANTPGASAATLAITSNDAATPTATVSLLGSGRTCDPIFGTTFVQNGSQCTYSCAAGFVDLDGDLNTVATNGCEYACTVVPGVDLPEASAPFIDQNCDGIDGTIAGAVFVSPIGNDNNAGTPDAPLRNIDTGVARASLGGLDVYIAGGSYTVASTLNLVSGVSVFGGFSSADWLRNDGDTAIIQVANATAVRANNTTNVTLDRVEIVGSNATTGSAYGILATGSTLVVRSAKVTAGRGANAGNGVTGGATRAADGPAGNKGTPGCEDSGGLCSSCGQPLGGSGGDNTQCLGHAGGTGGSAGHGGGNGGNGALGGGGGGIGIGSGAHQGDTDYFGQCNGSASQVCGHDGTAGGGGNDGAAAIVAFNAGGFAPTSAVNGTNGSAGAGGGGGGGGGGGDSNCDSYGGGGGGGGAGGCGGTRGTAGGNGGASIAIYAHASTVTITATTLVTGNGGTGGAGGDGQDGGNGGANGGRHGGTGDNAGNDYGGGGEQDDGSNGGRGGNGGAGGRGGHGGGGAGGPAVGIVAAGGASVTQTGNAFSLGTAGQGGASSGHAGPDGAHQNVLTVP